MASHMSDLMKTVPAMDHQLSFAITNPYISFWTSSYGSTRLWAAVE